MSFGGTTTKNCERERRMVVSAIFGTYTVCRIADRLYVYEDGVMERGGCRKGDITEIVCLYKLDFGSAKCICV